MIHARMRTTAVTIRPTASGGHHTTRSVCSIHGVTELYAQIQTLPTANTARCKPIIQNFTAAQQAEEHDYQWLEQYIAASFAEILKCLPVQEAMFKPPSRNSKLVGPPEQMIEI
jgi:hypothetical protein